MKTLITTITLLIATGIATAQNIQNLDSLHLDSELNGIGVIKLDSDSLATTFVIWVEKEVPLHRHNTHSETVIVLEGTGEFRMNDEVTSINAGDYIFIPMGTPHAVTVTSDNPMKVISIQAPEFDGTDREPITE